MRDRACWVGGWIRSKEGDRSRSLPCASCRLWVRASRGASSSPPLVHASRRAGLHTLTPTTCLASKTVTAPRTLRPTSRRFVLRFSSERVGSSTLGLQGIGPRREHSHCSREPPGLAREENRGDARKGGGRGKEPAATTKAICRQGLLVQRRQTYHVSLHKVTSTWSCKTHDGGNVQEVLCGIWP